MAKGTPHPKEIKLIDRNYQVLAELGSGLSGEIFKVQGPEGPAALKLLRTEVPGLNPEELIATFKFEFSLLKGLNHPNVIRIFDFGFDERLKRFYFTQELVEGASLQHLPAPTALEKIQRLFVQALQGLAYLHNHEVFHGDLKPDNLLVTALDSSEPVLKIIDFGISHPSFVQVAGTPAFMAPEKILKEATDARSDLYSLAVVFYTALTGENPFQQKSTRETLRRHLSFIPPSATTLRPDLDPVWSELLALMLKKNPRYRIASAEACLKFLEAKGEVSASAGRSYALPETWIGRVEILDQAKKFLKGITDHKKNSALIVIGEKGLGKDTLLAELKYQAELDEIEVYTADEEPQKKPAIVFLKSPEAKNLLEHGKLLPLIKKSSVALSISPELSDKLPKEFKELNALILKLRPLTQEETNVYLQEVTRNKIIPPPFLNALYRLSGGYPSHLTQALRHLLKDPLIVDASGKWHLAVFHEVEPTPEQLGLSESLLAHALSRSLVDNPKELWGLSLRRSSELANENQFDEALRLLNRLDKEHGGLFKGDDRLVARANILEKRGWIYAKQGRYLEAREAFASGLSLLQESESRPASLEIRLKNFTAFLDLQAGKHEDAIRQFEKNAQEAKQLAEEEQRKITNNELGSAYLAANRLDDAIERLKEDLDFFSTLPDPSFEMKASYNLAEAYCRCKKYPQAHRAYQRVGEIARKERQWDYLIRAYNGLGNTANLQGNNLESLDYYQRSLALAEYVRDYLSATTVAQNRGVLLSELGRLEEALHDLEISKQLLSKVPLSSHSRYLMARATLELGEVHLKKKDFQKSRNYFTEALNRAEEDPNLKSFCFYPLASLAHLALAEQEFETFRELYPKLVYLAEGEEKKKILADLLSEAPEDPRQGMEQGHPSGGAGHGPAAARTVPRESHFLPTALSQEALLSILKTNRALITEHDPDHLFQKILQYATELSGAESALLLEVSEENELYARTAFNTQIDQAQKEISHQIAHRVLKSGNSIATQDALEDQGFNQYQSVVSLKLRSIACVPIRLHQKVIGLLYLTHRNKTQLFSPEIVHILEAFGDQVGMVLQNAQHLQQLTHLNRQLRERLTDAEAVIDQLKTDLRARVKNPYPKILGKSPPIVETLQTLDRISDTNLSVLILGETGSGKELVARSIHDNSRRKLGRFVAVNCGAIPENLLESELFGYAAGAFTGANRDKKGLLEEAEGGTLFLDEVSELPLKMQVKLLRALQEKEIHRLGTTQPIPVDFRVIAATHRDLEKWVAEEKFREDLFYRLTQMVLALPPLRNRLEDLVLLSEHFLQESAKELDLKKSSRLSKELLNLMMDYPWPGNVRELENFIRTASAFAERGVVHPGNLPVFLRNKLNSQTRDQTPAGEFSKTAGPEGFFHPDWPWKKYEEALFAKALLEHQMNCEKAAEALGVGVATVYVKMRRYGLKNNAAKWEGRETGFPPGLTVAQLKQKVIEAAYQHHRQSPYAVAKQLEVNVGTVYRNLKG